VTCCTPLVAYRATAQAQWHCSMDKTPSTKQ
jgi:hypothetical protein